MLQRGLFGLRQFRPGGPLRLEPHMVQGRSLVSITRSCLVQPNTFNLNSQQHVLFETILLSIVDADLDPDHTHPSSCGDR